MKLFPRLANRFDRWLRTSAPNAAGRMGLYRILYSFFFLWFFSYLKFTELSYIPVTQWNPPLLFSWLSKPPAIFFPLTESLLVGLVIILLVGYRTRLTTVPGLFHSEIFTLKKVKDS